MLNKNLHVLEAIFKKYTTADRPQLGLSQFLHFLKDFELVKHKDQSSDSSRRISLIRSQLLFKSKCHMKKDTLNLEMFINSLRDISMRVMKEESGIEIDDIFFDFVANIIDSQY